MTHQSLMQLRGSHRTLPAVLAWQRFMNFVRPNQNLRKTRLNSFLSFVKGFKKRSVRGHNLWTLLWISASSRAGFFFLAYPYTIKYWTNMYSKRHIAEFGENISQFVVLARTPTAHPVVFSVIIIVSLSLWRFLFYYDGSFTELYCQSLPESAVISKVLCPPKKPIKSRSRERLQKTENIVF